MIPLISPQLFIGGAVAILCTVALRHDRWFVDGTTKGRRLTAKFGERKAVWLWRAILTAGIVFGLCLATGLVRPVDWSS